MCVCVCSQQIILCQRRGRPGSMYLRGVHFGRAKHACVFVVQFSSATIYFPKMSPKQRFFFGVPFCLFVLMANKIVGQSVGAFWLKCDVMNNVCVGDKTFHSHSIDGGSGIRKKGTSGYDFWELGLQMLKPPLTTHYSRVLIV